MALTKLQSFNIDSTGNFTFANITTTNANLGNAATANYFIGNGSLLTGLSSANSNYANYAGTIVNSAQPNITSVGTLTGLTISNTTGTINFTGTGNVTLGAVANLHISGGSSGQVLTTDGSGTLTWSTASTSATKVANGTSELAIPTSNGNIVANVGGTTIVTVSSTGATVIGNVTANNANLGNATTSNYFIGSGNNLSNIQGSNVTGAVSYATNANAVAGANVSGQVSYAATANSVAGGNVSGQVGNSAIAGTVYTAAQPNITSVGTLTGLNVSGDTTLTGNLTVSGSFEYANVTSFRVKDPIIEQGGNTAGGALTSNDGYDRGQLLHYHNGTNPVDAFMGWDTSNGEFAFASNATVSSDVVTFNEFSNIRANYFIGNGLNLTGVTAQTSYAISNGSSNITATLNGNVVISVSGTVGVVTVTSTGANVAGYVNASGNINGANLIGTHYGAGNNLSNIQGGNVSGQVANALIASTVYTNAQPNITSVGTLSNLTSNGNVNFSNTSNVTLGAVANLHISGGASGQILSTDGAGVLTWIPQTTYAPAYVSNGTSNVNVPVSNGNVTITVGGVSNVLVATTTGIVVKGNIDAGANYVKGNGYYLTDIDAGTANIANSIVVGNSAVKAQPNGNVYINVAGTSNTVVFTSTGMNIAGYANVTGNVSAPYFLGNGYYLTGLDAAGRVVNGTSNLSITTLNGNISLSVNGNANIVKVTDTGMNVAGYANITGNVNAPYFIGNGAFLTGVDTNPANISNGTSNVNIPAGSGNITMSVGGSANIVKVTGLGVNVVGNVNATYFVGNGAYLTGVDTSPANINNGTAIVQSYAAEYITGTSPAQYTDPAVTISMGGISNIFKVRTTNSYDVNNVLIATTPSVTVTGNLTATYLRGNGYYLTGVDTSPANISNGSSKVEVLTSSNVVTTVNSVNTLIVTQTGINVAGYVTATGNIDAGSSYVKGNGYYLTGVDTAGKVVSGNSNVSIPTANGNVTVSVAGNANVMTVTGTGVNVAGYANVTGNINAPYFVGNGYYLTGVDTAGKVVNGTSNLSIASSGGNITMSVAGNANVMTVTGVGVNVSGNVNATYFIGNGAFLTGVDTTPSSMSNGNSNVSIATSGGNVTVSVYGTANVVKVTPTGMNVAGYANITGNINAPYFIGNGAFLTGVDVTPASTSNGNSNLNIATANGNITMSVSGNVGIVTVTGTGVNVDGYLTTTGNVTGAYVKGNGYYLTGLQTTGPTIANGSSNINVPVINGNITVGVAGNSNVITFTGTGMNVAGYITVTGQITSTATTGTAPFVVSSTTQVANLNSATAGTVTTNAQPNITSVGTLTSLTVGPNSNVILSGTSGFVRANSIQGTDSTAGLYMYYGAVAGAVGVRTDLTVGAGGSGNLTANVGIVTLGDLGNVKVAGGASGYVIQTDGAGNLSWVSPTGGGFGGGANIGNGTANVRTFLNGNVTISSNGNANVVNVTGTGVIVTGNVDAGANYVKGNGFYLTGVDTAGKVVNGTSNLSITTSGGNVTVSVAGNANILTVTGTGANITGTANVTGNISAPFFIGNGFYLTGVDTAGKVVNGTSNISINTAGGNVSTSVNGNANITVVTGTGMNVAGYVNATGNVNGSNITAGGQFISTLAQGTAPLQVLSTTQVANLNAAVAGVVSTNAQPNITSLGSLTGLTVSNATGVVDFTTTANVTLGYIGNLHITGGSANYVLKTDGAGNLSWTAQSGGGGGGSGTSITNGTSNVNIATVSGNVTVTSNGNTTMTVTDTGANITGYANITGNVALSGANVNLGNVANLHIAGGANNYVLKTDGAGNLGWVAQSSSGSGTGAIEEFIATAGQTTFTITGGYNVGSAIVFVNGIQMNNTDYAATTGTTIVLSEPRNDGDIVRVLSSMISPAININSIKAYGIAISIAMGI